MKLIKPQHYKWYAVASFAVVGWVGALAVPPYNHISIVPLPIWRASIVLITLAAALLVTGLAVKHTQQIFGRCLLASLFGLYLLVIFGLLHAF